MSAAAALVQVSVFKMLTVPHAQFRYQWRHSNKCQHAIARIVWPAARTHKSLPHYVTGYGS